MQPIPPIQRLTRGCSVINRIILAGAILLLLGGCARILPTGEVVVAAPVAIDYCATAKPVRVSRADTRGTKEQADREYRKYVAACGRPPV